MRPAKKKKEEKVKKEKQETRSQPEAERAGGRSSGALRGAGKPHNI